MDWNKYFVKIAEVVSSKSSCISTQKGCVIVRDRQIISTGFNGPPRGYTHCGPKCPRKMMGYKSGQGLEFCPASHAETNALVLAAKHGISVNNAVMYCNFHEIPCRECSKLIINAGISKIILPSPIIEYPQPGLKGKILLDDCNIVIE
jgi:dCMP deaminase